MLSVMNTLPPGLLEVDPTRLYQILEGPTLIHLHGRREPPLFVSVLLHGNETTGLYAIQTLLRRYRDKELPRSLSLLIGNVAAARQGLRRLDGQPDYNRVWAGEGTPEHVMARQVLEEMRRRQPFAGVDVHNNTGLNPHYACISRLDNRFLRLATLFSRTVVYSRRPAATLAKAFAEFCPALTLECGQPDLAWGVEHALDYLDGCLHLSEFPAHPVAPRELDLLHTIATVRVPESVSFGFGDCANCAVCFTLNLDHLNFRDLPAGMPLARVNGLQRMPLEVEDEAGQAVGERFFVLDNGEIRTAIPVIPAMLTVNERVIRQDCLGYLMERMALEEAIQGRHSR